MSDYNKETHLGFIQGVIIRMGSNSFYCKGWAVTLFSTLLALYFSKESTVALLNRHAIAGIICSILLVFWYLDSFYLRQERLFRHLYEYVRKNDDIEPYSMSCKQFQDKERFLKVMFSRTMLPMYILLIMITVFIFYGTEIKDFATCLLKGMKECTPGSK